MRTEDSVVIVGAGPVGLTAACELLRRGVPCRVVDQAAGPSQFSKAFAVHARTLEVLDGIGVADALLERGIKVPAMHFYAHTKRVMSVDFGDLETRYPFVLSVPQSDTESVLRERLSRLGGEVEQGVTLTALIHREHGVDASVRHADGREETTRAIWVIGADGAHSTTRRLLGIGWQGAAYDIDFLVADGQLDSGPEGRDGHTYITDNGYVMLFPLPNGAHRVVVDVSPSERSSAAPTAVDVNRVLKQRGLSRLTFSDPFWISTAHIRRMLAETYRQGRVFLAGDAAHVHSPVGGQGLNTGIQDAHNLAWKLALVVHGRAPDSLLASYEIERRPVAADVLAKTDALTRLLTDRNVVRRAVRTRLLPLIAALPPVRRTLTSQASGLAIDYRGSTAVSTAGRRYGGVIVGQRAPDCILNHPTDSEPLRLYNEVFSDRYTLLLCIGHRQSERTLADVEATANSLKEYIDAVNVRIVTLAEPSRDIANQRPIFDTHGQVHARYTDGSPGMSLIRPDGYVAFSAGLAGWSQLHEFLGAQLKPTYSRDASQIPASQAA